MTTRHFSVGLAFLFLLSLFAGCGGRGADEGVRDDSDTLYHTSLKLIAIYTDSIRLATDSVTAANTFNHFQLEMDSLNRAVEADTDLLLTPGQNDTIYEKLSALLDIYHSKLAIRTELPDSITQEPSVIEE